MALVYEARRESLEGVQPRVAIKLILPEHAESQTFKQLFINEARLGASMHHQNLVQIQDFDCAGDQYFLVMEYVEGLTLRRIISLCGRHGVPIPLGVIAEIGRQACDGLHYAHCATDDRGRHLRLVHRDIKPSNLILNPHGVVKVLDFGISKGRLRQERSGSVKGTWGYMAPEQAAGEEVYGTADVFGAALVLVELAARKPMFVERSREEIKRLLMDDHAARMAATLDPMYASLVPALVRALQRDPKARFGSAEAFGRALSALLPDPITARDEVVRFYEQVVELGTARPPAAAPPASHGSLPVHEAPASTAPPVAGGWVVPAVLGVGIAGAILAALLFGLVRVLQVSAPEGHELEPPPVAAGTAPGVPIADEPAGPAGEGAPGERRPPPRNPRVAAPAEAPQVVPDAPPEPVRVRVVRPVPAPVVAPQPAGRARPVAADPAPPEVEDPGTLIVQARQDAEVYIAGQYIGPAPVKKQLPPGRYAVSIVAADGRRRTFEVDLVAGKRVKKSWDFERNSWR